MTLEAFIRAHGELMLTGRIVRDAEGRERVTFIADPSAGDDVLRGEVRANSLQGIELIDRPAPAGE